MRFYKVIVQKIIMNVNILMQILEYLDIFFDWIGTKNLKIIFKKEGMLKKQQ